MLPRHGMTAIIHALTPDDDLVNGRSVGRDATTINGGVRSSVVCFVDLPRSEAVPAPSRPSRDCDLQFGSFEPIERNLLESLATIP